VRRLHRAFASVAVILWIGLPAGPPLAAQSRPEPSRFIPSVDEIRALLQSSELPDQVWGAWLASQSKAVELVPLLQRVADAHPATALWPEPAVRDVALDALVQLHAQVPAAWARSFHTQYPAQSLILLSRAADADEELADLARTGQGFAWFGAANLLVARRSPRLAAVLLRDLEIVVTVAVSTDGSRGIGSAGGLSVSVACGGAGLLPGFPPVAWYAYSGSASAEAVMLADGPTPVYYRRKVSAPGELTGGCSPDRGDPTAADRLSYVAALFGESPGGLPVRASESRAVAWRGQAALDAAVADIRADIQGRFRQMLARLVERTLLSPTEAVDLAVPRLTIAIRDLRISSP